MAEQKLIPVVLRAKFRGRNSGETHGFTPKLAMKLVNSGVARWYDEEAQARAEKLGFSATSGLESPVDIEIAARAEEKAAEMVAAHDAELAARDVEIARLKAKLEEKAKGRGRGGK